MICRDKTALPNNWAEKYLYSQKNSTKVLTRTVRRLEINCKQFNNLSSKEDKKTQERTDFCNSSVILPKNAD